MKRADTLELFALSAVASPFAGYGMSGVTGHGLYFILGAGVFCLWMLLTSVLFVGDYQQTPAIDSAEASDAFDASQSD